MKAFAPVRRCRGTRLNRGFALLLILVAVTLITLLALGMLAISERDRLSAHGISNGERTELLAQAALEHATALLDHNIPQPLPPGVDPNPLTVGDTSPDHVGHYPPTNWVVSPGLLTLIGPGNTASSVKYVQLSSSTTDPYTPVTSGSTADPNLNAEQVTSISSGTATYPIRGDGQPLYAGWVNILKDPTQPASATNPLVGRYAFWIDDESAKVNVNMAYGKPANVNLTYSDPVSQMVPTITTSTVSTGTSNPIITTQTLANAPNGGDFSEMWLMNQYQIQSNGIPAVNTYLYNGQNGTQDRRTPGTFAIKIPTTDPSGNVDSTFYPLWHPAAINLDFLLQAAGDTTYANDRFNIANWVHNVSGVNGTEPIYNWRPLVNPEQIKSFLTTNPSSTYENLKFNITTKARSPEFNVFGKSRLYLESRPPLWNSDMFFQWNYDADGPEYFQGTETLAGSWSPNLTGIDSVVNAIEDKLTRQDWPGMPAKSLYDKWAQQTDGNAGGNGSADMLREIDQIAWNIAAWGTYAADRDPAYNVGYSGYVSDQTNINNTYSPWPGSTNLAYFLNNWSAMWGGTSAIVPNVISQRQYNAWCQKGPLSGKAILPWFPQPLVNEVAIEINIIDPSTGLPMTDPNNVSSGYYVSLGMQYELYNPVGMPPFRTEGGDSAGATTFPIELSYSMVDSPYSEVGSQSIDFYWGATSGPIASGAYDNNVNKGDSTNLLALGGSLRGSNTEVMDTGTGQNISNATAVRDDTDLLPGSIYVIQSQQHTNVATQAGYQSVDSAAYVLSTPVGTETALALDHNPNTLNPQSPPANAPKFTGRTLSIRSLTFRLVSATVHNKGTAAFVCQLIPVWDSGDTAAALQPPAGQAGVISFGASRGSPINLDVAQIVANGGGQQVISMEIEDPRNGGNSNAWVSHPDVSNAEQTQVPLSGTYGEDNSIGYQNSMVTSLSPSIDTGTGIDSKYRWFDCGRQYYDSVDNRPSIGMLSTVPLGMQRNIPFDSLKFTPNSDPSYPPDWLLLDIVAPSLRPYSYMNSAMGKVNLNAQIYNGGDTVWPNTSVGPGNPARWQPLQAVFQNMESSSTVAGAATSPSTVVGNIISHTAASSAGGLSPAEKGDGTHPGVYDYVGELCDTMGVADGGGNVTSSTTTDPAGQWEAEGLIRNVANLITTKSNTFTVWGIAQSIQKSPLSKNYGTYDPNAGDSIGSTKRFTSTIERYVWPGKDGVPGNGAVNTSGNYIHTASGTDNTDSYDGASSSYYSGLPKVGLFPWLPLPVPQLGADAGSPAPANTALGPLTNPQWPLLDGPDIPTFPNVPAPNVASLLTNRTTRYDYGQRSANTGGQANAWGTDDPTATVNWTQTTLENANNPVRAWMKYRTMDFRYLDQ
jgi:hypothetical protein